MHTNLTLQHITVVDSGTTFICRPCRSRIVHPIHFYEPGTASLSEWDGLFSRFIADHWNCYDAWLAAGTTRLLGWRGGLES